MAKRLRGGYTTGACVAAGAKAAALYMQDSLTADVVEITALDGTRLMIPIKKIERLDDGRLPEGALPPVIRAEVVKDAGDDPDITNGTSVFVTLTLARSEDDLKAVPGVSVRHENILFEAGEGIGHATKPGLSLSVGEPAINPGPRQLVHNSLLEAFGSPRPCRVRIDIPAGRELAKKTLNPVLGIEGGISIIGTTGVLRPMSEEAFKESLVPQIKVARAAGFDTQIFVPGKIGERIAASWGLPEAGMVQTSNFIGYMLEAAAEIGLKRILLFGHIGKLAKVAAGVFHTHNRVGDARLEVLAAYSGAMGMPGEGIERILGAVTTEEALPVIGEYGLERVYERIAARASYRAERLIFNKVQVGTVLVTLQGELLGMDDRAREIGGDFGWNIK
ncbi:MAG: cobalamin biosynthesis protein CbiD [Selenomonadaceae bacterium]|nr:cobalamin biosynthesis protein CbiD [Selenomonadaceae bacterium]MBQ5733619.1 cobalamin biosynthesis protein CbiD [Selenomonadaceae bacterium]MBR0329553.1 cobalamin biosynthesis protein CbiD [Selenomonadaceae bacterium]